MWVGAESDGGPIEIAWITVLEVDEAGEPTTWVTFDLDDLAAAYAELDARYLAGEAAPYARTWESYLRIPRAVEARDWARFAAAFAPGAVMRDSRPLGFFSLLADESLSPDNWVASVRVLLEARPDARFRLHHVLALDDQRSLTIQAWEGAESEGTFEIPSIFVTSYGVEGIGQIDTYSIDQLDEARACHEALRPDPPRIPPNAAARAADRSLDAVLARDWQAVDATCAPSLVFEDRRRLLHTIVDRDMFIANAKIVGSSGPRLDHAVLATAGDRLVLTHLCWSMQRGLEALGMDAGEEPAFEIEHLQLTEVDAEGRIVAAICFDPDDRRAASAEMLERYARNEESRCIPAGVFQQIRAVSARDVHALRAALPDDFVMNDRRRTGSGLLAGADRVVAAIAAEFEQTSEVTVELLYVVAAEKHGLLAMTRTFGTLADGGEYELVYVVLGLFQGDRYVGMELFEPEHLDVALARFEELRAGDAGSTSTLERTLRGIERQRG
jgi:hypothetical protein